MIQPLEKIIRFLRRIILISLFLLSHPAFSIVQVIDSETEDVVRELVTPILRAAGEDPTTVRFYVLLDESINAFVAGGRNIFINTGVITAFNDPDVLKGVVAHELGHMAGGHLARRDEKVRELQKQSIVAMSLLGVAALASGRPDALLGGLSGHSHLLTRDYLSYSRSQESAADQAAVRFLHESHNTLKGLIKLQEYIIQKNSQYLKERNPYASTHPLSPDRLSALQIELEEEPKGFRTSDKEKKDYARLVGKLRGFLKRIDHSGGAMQSDLDPFSRNYEKAIVLYEKHDAVAAMKVLNDLIRQEPENGYLYELKGQILFRAGAILESLEYYKKAIFYVQNPLMKAEYAVALVNSIDFYDTQKKKQEVLNEVVSLLESVLAADLKNPYIYRMLATAYGKLGDLGYSNLMLAEEALMEHKYGEAKKFAELAEKDSKNRSRLKLKVDDIMREVKNLTS